MRIQAEPFLGGLHIVVEHHQDVTLDPAPVVDAVQAALRDALSAPLPGVAAVSDARRSSDEQGGAVAAERAAVDEMPDHSTEAAQTEVGPITALDSVADPGLPEVAADSAPRVEECPGERSHDALRERALELLDDHGLPEHEVCERLDITLTQLRRWDPAGHDGLAVSGGGRR